MTEKKVGRVIANDGHMPRGETAKGQFGYQPTKSKGPPGSPPNKGSGGKK